MVDKKVQIETLLYGNVLDLARKTLGVTHMRDSSYADVFTVTAEEVHEYVAEHGLCDSGYQEGVPLDDGFYYYETDDGGWRSFAKDRGKRYAEKTFTDYELGKKAIVDSLLRNSGTGDLYW